MICHTEETKDHNGEHINAALPLKTSNIVQYHVTDKEIEAAGHALLEDTITMYENPTQGTDNLIKDLFRGYNNKIINMTEFGFCCVDMANKGEEPWTMPQLTASRPGMKILIHTMYNKANLADNFSKNSQTKEMYAYLTGTADDANIAKLSAKTGVELSVDKEDKLLNHEASRCAGVTFDAEQRAEKKKKAAPKKAKAKQAARQN
ncbi:hypothetical protein CPB85DRAFT_1257905 [Mucidula mucida]|nr:hypothetical protein CPB85DRAFT_1257905 [Mucidula mucida]